MSTKRETRSIARLRHTLPVLPLSPPPVASLEAPLERSKEGFWTTLVRSFTAATTAVSLGVDRKGCQVYSLQGGW